MESLDSAITIVGAVQGFFISFILLSKKENRRSNVFLSLFLIFLSIGMALRYIMLSGIDIEYLRKFFGPLFLIFPSLVGPFVYLYVKSMLSQMNSFYKKEIIHFVPSILIFIVALLIPLFFDVKSNLKEDPDFRIFLVTILGFSFIHGLIYTVVSMLRLIKHEKDIERYFSDKEKMTLSWIKNLLSVIVLIFIVWNSIFWGYFLLTNGQKPNLTIQISVRSLLVFLIFLISYYALKQPEIFNETLSMEKDLTDEKDESNNIKYEKHSLDEMTRKKHYKNLTKYMIEKQPFFNENLTIKDLADSLSISTHHLSIVINSEFNQNFYNFVNTFRIEEVKKSLALSSNFNKNILEIAYSVGFNSKSTFNTFFKRSTGKTPTEYRRSIA